MCFYPKAMFTWHRNAVVCLHDLVRICRCRFGAEYVHVKCICSINGRALLHKDQAKATGGGLEDN